MNILLLSMPDSFEHMPAIVIRMPNGALTSLAGNIDAHHRVWVVDLILVQDNVRPTLERLVRELAPDVVGLSIMTFQRRTARKVIRLLRALRPEVRVVIGGYDPTLAPEAYAPNGPEAVDFIVRGEGEQTFSELLRALESGNDGAKIQGLSFRSGDIFRHNPARPVQRLDGEGLRLPNRRARYLQGYTVVGRNPGSIRRHLEGIGCGNGFRLEIMGAWLGVRRTRIGVAVFRSEQIVQGGH
jgi:anaerobic magnesium-protoporphyrin IX monomethyl ester cyclase